MQQVNELFAQVDERRKVISWFIAFCYMRVSKSVHIIFTCAQWSAKAKSEAREGSKWIRRPADSNVS